MFSVVKGDREWIIKDPKGRIIKVIFDDDDGIGEQLALDIVTLLNK